VSQLLLFASPPVGGQGVAHCPVGLDGGKAAAVPPGAVSRTHQLTAAFEVATPSLQVHPEGQSAGPAHTLWHCGPLPEPSSMQRLPAAHADESHADPPPQDATRNASTAHAKTTMPCTKLTVFSL
jgi:hypothetical protein